MNTATYIYIFNLALADFLVLATLPFQGTDVLLDSWPFGASLCKIVVGIDYYNMFTSVFTLTVMSVDRYIAVCHPVRSLAVRTTSKAKVVNVGVWALASAFGVPVMVMAQLEVEPNGSPSSPPPLLVFVLLLPLLYSFSQSLCLTIAIALQFLSVALVNFSNHPKCFQNIKCISHNNPYKQHHILDYLQKPVIGQNASPSVIVCNQDSQSN